ncbi:MAG: YesL family protein [Chloroflexi bacterium]|nr:YesL family protein [Chloroflexota bacterium]
MSNPPVSTPRTERAELVEHAERWGSFVLVNILWALLCIPLVTIPAATAGLFAYWSTRTRGFQTDVFSAFFGGVRAHWLKATLIGIVDLVVGGLVVLNTSIFAHMDMTGDPIAFLSRSVTLFAAAALVMVNLYAWPLLVMLDDMSVKQVLLSSLRLIAVHPLQSFLWSLAVVFPVMVTLFLPRGFIVLVTASVCAWIACVGTWPVIQDHLSAEQIESLLPTKH